MATRIDTVTSPVTLGAGRRQSYSYPALGQLQSLNVPGGDAINPRPGGTPSPSFWLVQNTGAPPAPVGAIIYLDRVTWAITSSTGTGTLLVPNFGGVNRPLTMPFQTERAVSGSMQGVDDYWCWSLSCILAFDAIPGVVTGDLGITIGVGTRAEIRGAAQFGGVEIGPTAPNTIGVVVRQADGGAVTLVQDIATGFNVTVFHKYEIRLLSPTLNGEARIKFLIDNVPLLSVPYGVGTVLPSQNSGGVSTIGFTPGIANKIAVPGSTTRMYLPPYGMTVASAPIEEALP